LIKCIAVVMGTVHWFKYAVRHLSGESSTPALGDRVSLK